MIENISKFAETVSGNIVESRRGFFVRLGKVAAAAAVALGGVLLLPKEAQATISYYYFCAYRTSSGANCGQIYHCGGCPQTYKGCALSVKAAISNRCPKMGDPSW